MTSYNNKAFIALGSNLNNPELQIKTAIKTIEDSPNITLIKAASLYKTKPYGHLNQDKFINSVIKISTNYTAQQLLKFLQNIETQQHRVRAIKWGPRTIDLDILAFNNEVINTENLIIPHYDLQNRAFVLQPWCEIEPNYVLPDGSKINNLLAHLTSNTNKHI